MKNDSYSHIEFKGKRLVDGAWVCGDLIKEGRRAYIRPYDEGFVVNGTAKSDHVILSGMKAFDVDVDTVSRYAGVVDADGNNIYVNDIIIAMVPPFTRRGKLVNYGLVCSGGEGSMFGYVLLSPYNGREKWIAFDGRDDEVEYEVVGNEIDDERAGIDKIYASNRT